MRKVKLGILMLSGMAVFLSAFSQEKIYIDCFGANGGAGWNNVNITAAGTSSPLNTSENTASGITLSVSNRMTTGTWTVSSGSYAGDALEFLPSGSNGAFGSVPAWGTHPPCPQADMVFSGLETNIAYTFTYFASRNNDGTGWVRESAYILKGASLVTNYLDAADNFTNVAISSPLYPDASGKIVLTLKPGPNNNADNNYFYLNALKVEYTPAVVESDSEVIYIDPTSSAGYIGAGWNGLSFKTANATLALTTANELASGISAEVITKLADHNLDGSLAPMGAAAQFAPAGGDSVYGCDLLFAGSLIAPLGVVRFAGLKTNVGYTFTMYASRMGVSDNRDAVYTLAGAATNSVVLNAAGNNSNVAIISNVYADVNGVVDFSMVSGANNNNEYKFFYLSAMKIEYTPKPVEVIYIDPTSSAGNIGAGWNGINFTTADANLALTTDSDLASGISATVITKLAGFNGNGSTSPTNAAAEFAPAGGDSAYGCDALFLDYHLAPVGVMRFSGLNTNVSYTFTMYASRMGASDTRDAVYTLAGAATNSVVLDAVNNDSNVVIIPNVYADVNGVVDFSMVSGPNNNNDYKFFYISAMKIEYIPAEVEPPPAGSSKNLLFFGNSFSQGSYVPGLVQSLAVVAGYNQPRVVADLAGGTDLAYHITRVNDYPQNNVDSSLLPAGDTWDHVIMQGYSTEATHLRDPMVFKTNAVTLYQLVKNHASGKGAGVEGVLYETWARSPKHSFYPGSFADPAAMQLEIRTNYNGAAELITAAEGASSVRIARVGSAFETSRFDPSLYASDEYHQSDLGAHLAAMVLYKTIYAQDATNLSYTAAVAANWTTMTSNQWHDLTMWADGVATSTPPPIDPPGPAVPNNNLVIYIDPHGGEAPASWNNASFVSTTVMELKNTKSNLTGITLSVTNTMQDGSTFGSAAPTSAAAEFAPAGNTGAYGNNGNPNCDVLFTGMTPGRLYWFTFYNSRMAATDNRGTAYRLTGATQVAGSLNAANNSSNVILLSVEPAADGSVLLFIEKSADNDNPDGFYYLNAMKIESYYYGTIIRFQ